MQKRPSLLGRLASPAMRRWRLFMRDETGVTAVEFAILALPFFSIIVAIMETSVILLAGAILDSAVQDTSRVIRTGRNDGVVAQSCADSRRYDPPAGDQQRRTT